MDAYHHLNNGSYVEFLQEARVNFLHSGDFAYMLGDEPVPGAEGPNPNAILVTGHQVEYLRAAEHGSPVQVTLVVDRLGAARFTLAYDLVSDGHLIARARTVLCPFDLETNQIRRLTPLEKAWFQGYAEPVEPLPTVPKMRVGDHPAFEFPLHVRWGDLDSYRHANNVKYFTYVQEARVALLRDLADRRPAGADRAGNWMVVRQDMEYAVQIDFRPEPYLVRTAVQRIGRTSLTLAAEIIDPATGTLHASSRTVLVHMTIEGPTALPDWLREAVAPWELGVPTPTG
ncbi:acyl-CoA thioesterase [Granulicoccus sp. GXG6511]|uniref:acyl-CoA thioesterase n=1 Tax=Granulicoccus sp. GXG6511 TaxID=3381351 RepID=UPI003D7D97F5